MKLLILILFILFNYSNATCIAERKKQQLPLVYIPTCNESNTDLYKSLQCNGAIGSCWCVDVVTGEQSDHVKPFGFTDSFFNKLLKEDTTICDRI